VKGWFLSASSFRQSETCPDCIERDDVDLLGRVRHGRYARVVDCLGCGGTGRVSRQKVDITAWWVSNRERLS
jgi:hypothetical protein